MVNGITMIGAILSNKSPVSLDQVTPIARLTGDPLVIVVPANSPIKNVQELAAAAKADPAKVTWAGGSAGGADHILAALFTKAAGSDPAKVNYIAFSGGGEALAAMLGGRVTAGVSGYGEFESQIKAGKLRALAISSGKRLAGADVPTLKEQGMDVEVVNWRAIMAAPGITADQRKAHADTVEKLVKSKEWAEILKQRGWEDFYLAGERPSGLPQGGAGPRRRHAEVDRPREVLRHIEGARLGLPLSLPHSEAVRPESTVASTNRLKKDRANFHGSEVTFMSSAGERTVNGKRELTEGLAAQILDHIRGGGLPVGTHLTAQELAERFSVSRFPVGQALQLLAAKGVLTHQRNRGYFVSDVKGVSPESLGLTTRDDASDVYFRMADDHLHGRLPDPASEAYLKETYRLTKAQLNAVLGRIAQEGWAERRPGYGWSFSPMLTTPESLEQTYRVRLALEPAALAGADLPSRPRHRRPLPRGRAPASPGRHRDGQRRRAP